MASRSHLHSLVFKLFYHLLSHASRRIENCFACWQSFCAPWSSPYWHSFRMLAFALCISTRCARRRVDPCVGDHFMHWHLRASPPFLFFMQCLSFLCWQLFLYQPNGIGKLNHFIYCLLLHALSPPPAHRPFSLCVDFHSALWRSVRALAPVMCMYGVRHSSFPRRHN